MLTKPEAGWTDFSIDNEHIYSLSYLTDVGIEWLDQAIHGLETLEPFTVHGFCEPNRLLCTVSYWNSFVIFEDDEGNEYYDLFGVNLKMIDFCKALYTDIAFNVDAWVLWDSSALDIMAEDKYDEMPGETYNGEEYQKIYNEIYSKRKSEFTNRLERLKNLISESEEYFGPNRCFF